MVYAPYYVLDIFHKLVNATMLRLILSDILLVLSRIEALRPVSFVYQKLDRYFHRTVILAQTCLY